MRLSELKTGDKAVVVKVLGHGGFRKRIVEMGFIRGKKVEVMLAAPLNDPVKYRIMGYEISLRREEASLIEVMTMDEAERLEHEKQESQQAAMQQSDTPVADVSSDIDDEELSRLALNVRKTINVALVGNPNCGKTSLFNIASGAHEHVGNYSGVTVDAKMGHFRFEGYNINLVDLPGTYSLSCYSPEELYVRKEIVEKTPDIILNVIDSSNIERNLYLTTQLIDMNLRVVCALNMYDELLASGNKFDHMKLGELLGVPMIPTVSRSGKGLDRLFRIIICMYEGNELRDRDGRVYHSRHIHINHGADVEKGISALMDELKKNQDLRARFSTRFLAIKLLENDKDIETVIGNLDGGKEILKLRDAEAEDIKKTVGEDSETTIMDAKYGFISGALKETFVDAQRTDTRQVTKIIDSVVTNRYVGFPLFFVLLFVMFEVTFTLGQYPMDWIEAGVGWVGDAISARMDDGPLKAMLVSGILGGVGAVIVFLPQILILYFFISLMEESGYMARAAFIMDKLMHRMGLHGKSFIPLIMGFGCNVPAIMSTRTIESPRSRLVTMLVLPLMSCSARLPIYLIITGVFFAKYQALVVLSLYAIGIFLSVVMARIFSKFFVRDDNMPFVMELPPYRCPTAKAIFRHTWEKGRQYLWKMGHIILVASIIVWFLGYYPDHDSYDTVAEQQENSYLGQIGKAIEPAFKPCGFDWKLDVGLLAGAGAKELVASTMGVLYADTEGVEDTEQAAESGLADAIRAEGVTPLAAFCYLLFVLVYFPCIATISAIKGETGQWKWALFTAGYTTLLAWIVSASVYQIGMLLA